MNRRGFLAGLAALVGGVAIEQAIPFGRVWSFPKNIVIAKPRGASVGQVLAMMYEQIRPNLPKLYGNIYPSFTGKMLAMEQPAHTHFETKGVSHEIRQSA